jgi:hypothetical protein
LRQRDCQRSAFAGLRGFARYAVHARKRAMCAIVGAGQMAIPSEKEPEAYAREKRRWYGGGKQTAASMLRRISGAASMLRRISGYESISPLPVPVSGAL